MLLIFSILKHPSLVLCSLLLSLRSFSIFINKSTYFRFPSVWRWFNLLMAKKTKNLLLNSFIASFPAVIYSKIHPNFIGLWESAICSAISLALQYKLKFNPKRVCSCPITMKDILTILFGSKITFLQSIKI